MTVEKLMEKKRDLFDYILIETTGLADPGQVAGRKFAHRSAAV
jgi:G3E family GTPase